MVHSLSHFIAFIVFQLSTAHLLAAAKIISHGGSSCHSTTIMKIKTILLYLLTTATLTPQENTAVTIPCTAPNNKHFINQKKKKFSHSHPWQATFKLQHDWRLYHTDSWKLLQTTTHHCLSWHLYLGQEYRFIETFTYPLGLNCFLMVDFGQ